MGQSSFMKEFKRTQDRMQRQQIDLGDLMNHNIFILPHSV